MDQVDKIVFGFFTIGGLIFVYLVLNQGGGKPATNLLNSIGSTGVSGVKALQGR